MGSLVTRIRALLAYALLVIALAACGGQTVESPFIDSSDCGDVDARLLPVEQVQLNYGDVTLTVDAEIAVTLAERQQGLMCRGSMRRDGGMYFVGTTESRTPFWMFNTYVPLDALYLNADGLVVWSERMEPCTRLDDEPRSAWSDRCTHRDVAFAPDEPYVDTLELLAGWLATQGIALGDTVGVMRVVR